MLTMHVSLQPSTTSQEDTIIRIVFCFLVWIAIQVYGTDFVVCVVLNLESSREVADIGSQNAPSGK